MDSQSIILEAPGTKSQKVWKHEPLEDTWKNILQQNTEKLQKQTKMSSRNRSKIDQKSTFWGGACQQGCKTWILEVRGGFSGFRGYPRGPKLIKNVEKAALPNAWKKRYVVLSSFHTLSSRDRNAIQPRRKERSSAQFLLCRDVFSLTMWFRFNRDVFSLTKLGT